MNLKILITGCGGDIGQSVGKIIKQYEPSFLIGCDISDKNAASFIFDNFFLSLPCSDKNYLNSIEKVIKKHSIDIVIPIAEPELRFYSNLGNIDKIGKAKLICANPKSLKIGFDKLLTSQFLEANNLPFPKTTLLSDIEELSDYPAIIKSRTGSGSSTVYIVKDENDFIYLKRKHPEFILQEYLPSDQGEFTCGLFRSEKGEIRSIILKRELTGGYSGYGEVIVNLEITNLLETIAERLELNGSINVQLRMTSRGPVIFEINPRFSSTVLFRHMFGFKDLLWSIEDKVNMPISNCDVVKEGRKFYKGFSEFID
ncbi:MAG: ATP-grasp domain-containing protein [Cellulophaga sp.]